LIVPDSVKTPERSSATIGAADLSFPFSNDAFLDRFVVRIACKVAVAPREYDLKPMQSFRNTLKLFAVLPVLLASVACDNSSSGSAEPAASMALPIATSNGSIIEVVDPEGGSGDIPLDLDDPSDPMQNDIELNNSGAEELSTDEGNELSGWLASEQCSRGVLDVAPGNGSAYFQLDRGCALEQEIEFENNTGSDVVTESLSLLFDAALKSGESGTLLGFSLSHSLRT